ncbi:glycosyltransferase [Flavobacterium sp.]|uniref:glycosyltransferase n=1 Tax=Flavobacterium sp. TaxID=239 RepID=UPI0025C0AD30|nr:glycosyltransferase [Flavobacterium sp.]MBA4153362.1 glycosyl transferase family 1 [Flavobacterium sp.]
MPKIKVLHIIKSLGRGGAEMLLQETIKKHNQHDFEFHYLYFLPWKDQMVESIQSAGGIVTCFSAKNNISLLCQYRRIIKYCRQHQIQLIHAHLPWAGFVSRLVHRLTGIPLLYTEHNIQERYHFATKIINKYTFNCQSMGIGVSEDVTNSIQKNIFPIIPVQTVLNGVNTENFTRKGTTEQSVIRKQFGIPDDAFVVGTVSVFRFQKRLDLWLEILKTAVDKDASVYGIIVGAGPLQAELEQKHKALGLEGKVFFAGLQVEVRPYYEAMDSFMMCSSFEGLPIALLEAMSMECAILTTDAGGIKEVVRNNQEGMVVSVENWAELANKIELVKGDDEFLKKLQQSARIRVIDSFSMDNMVVTLESLYRKYTS